MFWGLGCGHILGGTIVQLSVLPITYFLLLSYIYFKINNDRFQDISPCFLLSFFIVVKYTQHKN